MSRRVLKMGAAGEFSFLYFIVVWVQCAVILTLEACMGSCHLEVLEHRNYPMEFCYCDPYCLIYRDSLLDSEIYIIGNVV